MDFRRRKPTLSDLAIMRGLWRQHPMYQGCIGHWIVNEGGGRILRDISRYGDGTLSSAALWVVGDRGSALDFPVADTHVAVPSNPILEGHAQISLACRFNATDTPGSNDGRIISKTHSSLTSDDYSLQLASQTSEIRARIRNASGTLVEARQATFSLNEWIHAVATYDGSQILTYKNGALSGVPVAQSGVIIDSNQPLTFGDISGLAGTRYFIGLMDDIRIYNTALDAAQVRSLYEEPYLPFEWAMQFIQRTWFLPSQVAAGGMASSPMIKRSNLGQINQLIHS